jgi:hypothetical protein
MFVKQISVFIENKKGRLASLTSALGEGGVDILAITIADTTQYGILRCIVDKTDLALSIAKEAGFTATTSEVLAVEVPDKPGGLSSVFNILTDSGVNVEYLYSFSHNIEKGALVIFKVNDIEAAVTALEQSGIGLLKHEDLLKLH